MSGPWELYQQKTQAAPVEGPWTLYQKAAPAPEPSKFAGQGVMGLAKELAEKRATYPQYPEIRTLQSDRIAEMGGVTVPAEFGGMEIGNVKPEQRQELASLQKMARGLLLAQDDAGRMDIVKKALPDATFQSGPEGSILIHHQGKTYYLNKPGASGQDFDELATMVGLGLVFGGVGGTLGKGLMGAAGRVLGTGIGLAGQSVTQDIGARDAGSNQPVSWKRAAAQGLLGAGFEVFAPLFSKGLQKLFPGGRGLVDGAHFTPKGEAWLRTIGIDPADVTPETMGAFKRFFSKTDDAQAAIRQAEAQSLPVPGQLTTGQATRDPARLIVETESAKLGGPAAEVMKETYEGQAKTAALNKQAIQEGIGGVLNPGQGAGNAQSILVRMKDAMKAQTNAAYDTARALTAQGGTKVDAGAVQALGQGIRRDLLKSYDLGQMPALKSLLDDLTGRATGQPGGQITAVKLNALEQWRTRATNAASSANPAEAKAIREAIGAYDQWIDDSVTRSLFTGDQAAIDAWKNARGMRRQLGKIFEQDDAVKGLTTTLDDGSGRLAVNYDEAVNYLFGRASLGAKKGLKTDLEKLRTVLGPNSPEWSGIRQEAFLRLFRSQPDIGFSGIKFAKELDGALREAPEVMGLLFTPDEIALMQQFKRYLVATTETVKIPGNVNTSNTAAARYFTTQLFGPLGRAATAVAGGVFPGIRQAWQRSKALDAARGLLPPRQTVIPPGATGAVGAGATSQ